MSNQIVSFAEALSFVKDPNSGFHAETVAKANEECMDFSEAVFSAVNDTNDTQKYQPRDVIKHTFSQDGLRLVSHGRSQASIVAKFQKPYQKNMLTEYWDGRYDRKFMRRPPMVPMQFNEAGYQTSLTPGEAWRLYTDIQPKMAVLEPDIPLSALVSTSFPSNSKIARIPEIKITRADASQEEIEEGALPKRGRIKFSKTSEEMTKAGILLELSDEFQGNDAPYGVDLVSMFMERAGVDDEIDIVAQVIKKALSSAGTAKADLMLNGRNILEMQSVFKRGRRADRVVGTKRAILDYIDALSKAYADQDMMTTGAMALNQPMILNSMSRPTLAGWLDDKDSTEDVDKGVNDAGDAGFTTGTGVDESHQLLWMDSMNSMGLITYQGDPYSAENFDVIRNIHQHVTTRWHAEYVQVDAPLAIFTIAR